MLQVAYRMGGDGTDWRVGRVRRHGAATGTGHWIPAIDPGKQSQVNGKATLGTAVTQRASAFVLGCGDGGADARAFDESVSRLLGLFARSAVHLGDLGVKRLVEILRPVTGSLGDKPPLRRLDHVLANDCTFGKDVGEAVLGTRDALARRCDQIIDDVRLVLVEAVSLQQQNGILVMSPRPCLTALRLSASASPDRHPDWCQGPCGRVRRDRIAQRQSPFQPRI